MWSRDAWRFSTGGGTVGLLLLGEDMDVVCSGGEGEMDGSDGDGGRWLMPRMRWMSREVRMSS